MSSKPPCCGQGSPESMINKFNQTKNLFQSKQHPHSPNQLTAAATTQYNPFSSQSSTPQFTSNGVFKYVRGKF